jgi:hypothetical protein
MQRLALGYAAQLCYFSLHMQTTTVPLNENLSNISMMPITKAAHGIRPGTWYSWRSSLSLGDTVASSSTALRIPGVPIPLSDSGKSVEIIGRSALSLCTGCGFVSCVMTADKLVRRGTVAAKVDAK